MNDKDSHLLEEKYKSLYTRVTTNKKTKVEEAGEAIPDGPMGSLAQVGSEELDAPDPEVRERPQSSNVFGIIRQIFNNEDLGFDEMVKLNYISNGIEAVMENKDGNQYKFVVTVDRDPKI